MSDGATPDAARLTAARDEVRTFLKRKSRFGRVLWVAAGTCEILFFVLMLVFMDFSNRMEWFIFFGFLMTYCPLIIFTWRNAVMIDRLYYRLVADLRYADLGEEQAP